jgi:hypothetical protein
MAGMPRAARRPMIEITTNSSTSVNPLGRFPISKTLTPANAERWRCLATWRRILENISDPLGGSGKIKRREEHNLRLSYELA